MIRYPNLEEPVEIRLEKNPASDDSETFSTMEEKHYIQGRKIMQRDESNRKTDQTEEKIKRTNLIKYPSSKITPHLEKPKRHAPTEIPEAKTNRRTGTKPGAKHKRLRKRTKSRGHGTLDMLDLEQICPVNTEKLDIHKQSIKAEFGTFGALPEGSRRLWKVQNKVSSKTLGKKLTKDINTGHYRLRIKLESTSMSIWKGLKLKIPGMDKKNIKEKCIQVKMWLLNKEYGHSKMCETKFLSIQPGNYCDFDMVITQQDVKEKDMELCFQITCTSSHIVAHVCSELHKIVLPPSPSRSSLNADSPILRALSSRSSRYPSSVVDGDLSSGALDKLFEFNTLVLEGEDQNEHIKRTRRERAKSMQLKALQKKELDKLREKEKRAKTLKTRKRSASAPAR